MTATMIRATIATSTTNNAAIASGPSSSPVPTAISRTPDRISEPRPTRCGWRCHHDVPVLFAVERAPDGVPGSDSIVAVIVVAFLGAV